MVLLIYRCVTLIIFFQLLVGISDETIANLALWRMQVLEQLLQDMELALGVIIASYIALFEVAVFPTLVKVCLHIMFALIGLAL